MYKILIEGPDKTGKDLLRTYIKKLSNYKYVVDVRGEISNMVYDRIKGRENNPENNINLLDKKKLYVFLDAHPKDLAIRALVTSHSKEDWNTQSKYFYFEKCRLDLLGYKVKYYNTSFITIYKIALEVIKEMEELCK